MPQLSSLANASFNATDRGLAVAKLIDAQTPGFRAEFDPEEAALVGAFREDALSEHDASESVIDPVQ